jgi:hypothetical protein
VVTGSPEAKATMSFETGEAARLLCRWDTAIQAFESASRDSGDPAGLLVLRAERERAFCCEAKGDLPKATETYRSILARFPSKEAAPYLGYVRHRMAMIDKYSGRQARRARVRRVASFPMSVHSLAAGADGKVYGGGCWDAILYVYDPASKEMKMLGRPVADKDGYKIRALATGPGGILYGGTMGYYRAHLFAYDPSKEWRPGADKGSNPRDLGRIPDGQIGVLAIVAAPDGRVYATSIDESYTLGTEPRGGAVFCWDPQAEKIVALGGGELFPADGMRFSYALCVGPNGHVYSGGGKNQLLIYVPADKRFMTRSLPTPGTVLGKSHVYDRSSHVNVLAAGPDGRIYGGTMYDYHLFAYDPQKDLMEDLGRQVEQGLSSYHPGLVLGREGRFYASTSWQFYAYDPKAGTSQVLGVLDPEEGMVTFMSASPSGGAYAACYTSHLSKGPDERRVPSSLYWICPR